MGSLRVMCLSLAVVVMVIESSAYDGRDCKPLEDCFSIVESFVIEPYTWISSPAQLTKSNYDEFCDWVKDLQSCIMDNKMLCQTKLTLNERNYMEAQIVHLCTDQGRKETLKVASSGCVIDNKRHQKLRGEIYHCIIKNVGDVDESAPKDLYCKYEQQRTQCINNVAADSCQSDYIKYLQELNVKAKRQTFGCPRYGLWETLTNVKQTLQAILKKVFIFWNERWNSYAITTADLHKLMRILKFNLCKSSNDYQFKNNK